VRAHRTRGGALVLTARDVTAQALLEHEHQRLLESVGEGLFVVDPSWRITHFNAAAERIVGVRRAQVLGRSLWEAFPALLGTVVERMYRETMATREPRVASAVPLSRHPGGPVAGTFDARSYPVEGGGVLALFTEVSERERQSRALAERSAENEQLRLLARAMAAEADSAALLRILCEAAAAHCGGDGATVAELEVGTAGGARAEQERGVYVAAAGCSPSVFGLRFPLGGSLTQRVVDAYRRTGEVVALRAVALTRDDALSPPLADGREIGPLVLAPLAAHGKLLGVIGVARAAGAPPFSDADAGRLLVIADHAALALWKARLIEEAHAASETRANFVATVSHELRTPLTALTGYGELLADEILGPLTDAQHDVMERMRSVTHQLTGMIEEILTFSSLEAGRELVRPRPTSAGEPVQAAAAVVEPLAAQKGLGFTVEIEPDVPPLVTDPDKVRQILVNLAGNAVKFTERGEVRVSVRREGDGDGWVRFAVTDTGPGIAAEDLGRLFQAFTQLHTGLTRRYGGTGLGLYISRRLAELLGGRVEVASQPGAGSTFSLVIPAAPA
jgi:PAS domain S-box-containing protein